MDDHVSTSVNNSTQHLMADAPFFVVGIGASAGGLESLERFFDQVPHNPGMAFVVIQHLSPDFKSMMDELLASHTRLPIHRAENGMVVEPNHIYLLPPKKEMIISGGRLHLADKDPKQGLTLPIDHFLRSLAHDCGPYAVAVILSGTGSDGSRGIQDVHAAGGLVVCEDGKSAKFDGMPLSAQETGAVDIVLAAEAIPAAILEHAPLPHEARRRSAMADAEPLEGVEAVFDLLRRAYDIDFSHYKSTTVSRRIERRLSIVTVNTLEEYVERLRDDSSELNALYKDLLIGVTKFFRDAEPFEKLEREVIPELLERVPPNEEIRAWVAGCATGEEAYSLAILLHEALEKAERPINIKIFATDVHKESLELASHGFYDEDGLAAVSEQRLRRYFTPRQSGYQIAQDLRQSIVFAQHNVIKDAPFTNLDLISCRNLLIYFQPQAQRKALSLFHFGLKTGGVLLLGSSETPGELASEFDSLDEHCKLYRKRRDIRLPAEIRLPITRGGHGLRNPVSPGARLDSPHETLLHVYDKLLDRFMPPSLLVNERRELVESFGGAERLLRLKGRRPSTDLLDLLDTDAKTSIAGALNRVMKQNRPLSFSGVQLKFGGEHQSFRISIEPLEDAPSNSRHFLISLEQISPANLPERSAQEVNAAEMSRDQLHHLENELQHAQESLQATIEELETSNEEMQATNQELVASNEELQSTNEELHSVNEELYTVNAEHQKKIRELAELNQDMEHLLRSTDVAIVFLDHDLCIRKFTPRIADVFDLMDHDIGRKLGTFSHRIRYDRLVADLQAVLADGKPRQQEVRDVDGRSYFMRLLPYRVGDDIEGVVLSLIDISVLEEARSRIAHLSAIVESSEDAIVSVEPDGHITSWNPGAERLYGYSSEEAIGQNLCLIVPEGGRKQMRSWFERVKVGEHIAPVEVEHLTKQGRRVHVSVRLSPMRNSQGEIIGASSISRDITERIHAEQMRGSLSAIVESSGDAIVGKNLDGTITSWNAAAERLYGYRAAEVIGESISLIVPDSRMSEMEAWSEQLRKGQRIELLEVDRVTKSGRRIHVSLKISPIKDSSGKVVGASAIARDITELKRALLEKQAGEDRIRLLLESTAEAIFGLDNNGNCTFVNPSCVKLLGYDSADELLGRNMHELIHHSRSDGTPHPVNECPICQSLFHGERVHLDEEILWRKDGTGLPTELWSYPMMEDGRTVGAVVTFLDVTARKQTADELREEVRRREQFLAMLSHELRNPLSAVRNATRLLNLPQIDAATDTNARRVIDRQTAQISRLLDDLLDVSRITQDKIQLVKSVIDLRETVEDVVQSVQSLADDREVEIEVRLPDAPVPVEGDPTRLEQIQANLLTNAIKYSPTGEHVRLEIAQQDGAGIIRVTDNGAGIAPEMLDRIFDMFVQSDETLNRAHGGMGVGLTLVRKLVELHHGTVVARSPGLGQGSEFEVRLPLSRSLIPARETFTDLPPRERTVEQVVVVEDQDDNRNMLKCLLEYEGFEVHTAATALDGLKLIQCRQPDVAVIDIGLPDLDGYEVARRIRADRDLNGKIVLIALTGYGQPQDIQRAREAGFDHHLVKPLHPERLVAILNDRTCHSNDV